MSHARYFEVFSALYDFQKRQSSHFLRLKQLSPGHYIIHGPTPRYFEMDELKKNNQAVLQFTFDFHFACLSVVGMHNKVGRHVRCQRRLMQVLVLSARGIETGSKAFVVVH